MNSLIFQKLREQIAKLSGAQKVALAAVTGAVIFALVMLLVWASRPDFALLYSKLDAAETAKVVEDLKSNSIPYQLRDGGTTIMVRKEDVYELRIKYAGDNIISSGAVGYELFDKNNLGLTDFMQRVNLKRALEGELSNTITQIEAIQQSSVHLVIPEQRLFAEQQKKATASVIVQLRPQKVLDRGQINGITNLVAASVEGLEPANVTIVDTYGHMLTKAQHADAEIGLSSSQYELRQNVEKYLAAKAQTMLDKVLGENNSIVRVSAELNFDKIVRTSEKVDPDNTVVLSEERNEETTTNTDTTLAKRENTVTNYELNKTVEKYEGSVGDIKHLSIAVFVNGIYKSPEEPNAARPEEEIQKITNIVKNAVGFADERSDQIEVQQLAFDRSFLDRETEAMASLNKNETMMRYVKIASAVLGVILLFLGLRSLLKKLGLDEYLRAQRELLLQEAQSSREGLNEKTEVTEEGRQRRLAKEAKSKLQFQEKVNREVVRFTGEDSERAARILRYWLVEDDD